MRLHLFEFHDQTWFPQRLRSAMTSYLVVAYRVSPFPKLWAERIARVLNECGLNSIVDLGSGSSGPVPIVVNELEQRGLRPSVTLTDLYPNASTGYWPEPVDATRVPPELSGVRTMFASFHHFRPAAAHAILGNAFELRRPICIFEGTARTPAAIGSSILIPLMVLLLTPSIRPVSAFQLFFTYLVPVIPVLSFWDGLVSQLRTYSIPELADLTRDLDSTEYRWEFGLISAPRVPVKPPYLIGHPR